MRHVFVVYSGITRLAAEATIQRLGLGPEEVVVFTGRYELPFPIGQNYVFRDTLRLGRNVVRFRRHLRRFDNLLTEVASDSSLAIYVPGLFTEHFYAMATHPMVQEVNFIEEGTSSLTTNTRQYARRRGGDSRLANLGAWGRFPHHLADASHLVNRAFHFTPEAFPDWPGDARVSLPWPSHPLPMEHEDLGAVVSIEAVVEAGHTTLEAYASVVAAVVQSLESRTGSQVGVKFHANVSGDAEVYITAAVRRQVSDVRVIPRDVTLELMFGPDGPLLVGAVTSSLHYAVVAGGRAETYVDLVGAPSLSNRLESLLMILPPRSRENIHSFEI